ncbi:MAG TPA: GntR family transcriptional regulator [Steroidobacteraceae bacterium]|nr:GntR family transcriptional regulator [Steroidobacteraceae bacterium]
MKRNRTAAPDVYATLKDMILSFELYPGSRFTETQLAERFGVSRTPIREALKRLEAEHYLTVRPKQGCFVRDVDIIDLTQRYQVRIELELLSLRLACSHMPDRELQLLADEWDPAVQRGRSAKPSLMDLKEESFHLALAAGGGNRPLYEYIQDINHHIRILRRLDFTSPERIDRTYEEHYGIVQHLLHRDLRPAQRLMRAHITQSMQFAKTLTLLELRRKGPGRGLICAEAAPPGAGAHAHGGPGTQRQPTWSPTDVTTLESLQTPERRSR